jgi:putative membrane protein
MAEQMAADHAKANEELKAIASSKGITLPDEPDRKHKQEYAKLEKLSAGSRFDEEYVARPGVIDHKDAVALFKKGSKDVQDADIKAFAEKTLPVIEHHYEMAQKLNK